ncbi:MAG: glycosyltransferase family 2 protein [Bacteroidota bacterium]
MTHGQETDISVVIVNWNGERFLGPCLDSLGCGLGGGPGAEVLVCDNASSDGSVAFVRRRYPEVTVLRQHENRGFAAAANAGIRVSSGEFILVANPDLVFQPGALSTLVAALRGDRTLGAVMPLLLDAHGRVQGGYARRLPRLLQVLFFHTILEPWSRRRPFLVRGVLESRAVDRGPVALVEQIPGACMLIRREVIREVGLMAEEYGLFFEDVDWCHRIRAAGWLLGRVGEARVVHAGGGTFERADQEWLAARMALSLLLFFRFRSSLPAALAAALIVAGNSVAAFCGRSLQLLVRPGGDRDALRASRRRHGLILALCVRRLLLGRPIPLEP